MLRPVVPANDRELVALLAMSIVKAAADPQVKRKRKAANDDAEGSEHG